MKRFPLLLSLLALTLTGCAPKGCRQDASSGLSAAELPAPVFGEATVAGRVTFEGTPPVMPVIDAAEHCGPTPITKESVVVGPDAGLANVLVSLEGGSPSNGYARPAVVLDQLYCRFTPHVTAVQVGQKLVVKNSDPEIHNVHYRPRNNPPANLSLPMPGDETVVAFDRDEPRPVHVDCANHPWMSGFVGVLAHPFFAVTGQDGRFAIANVPAGTYTLRAWHEGLGTREAQVIVGEAEAVTRDFVFPVAG